ncbi:hypothetical protein K661_00804 [Piscirickettsia salmonis LF-89 = ATCC VR-1361]|nr:hypothetical protein K661_00804 [Piscirickettsia salmonis LF-89 = ATCC VR-1361]
MLFTPGKVEPKITRAGDFFGECIEAVHALLIDVEDIQNHLLFLINIDLG